MLHDYLMHMSPIIKSQCFFSICLCLVSVRNSLCKMKKREDTTIYEYVIVVVFLVLSFAMLTISLLLFDMLYYHNIITSNEGLCGLLLTVGIVLLAVWRFSKKYKI